MQEDAIKILMDDHLKVKSLFKEFEAYAAKDKPSLTGQEIADKIIHELTVHASIEERVFYPLMREALMQDPDSKDIILEALEEHHVVKLVIHELTRMDYTDERFNVKVKVLTEAVKHHIEEEETEFFPKVRKVCSKGLLTEIGVALLDAKQTAPSRPVLKEEMKKSIPADPDLLKKVRALAK